HSWCMECVGGGMGGPEVVAGAGLAGLLSQAGQALNVVVAEAQAFAQMVSQTGQQLGNLVPAVTDQFVNPGQAAGSAPSGAGNTAGPGGLDPNDPLFRRLIQQTGESDPIKAIAKASIEGPAREGASNGTTVLGRYPAYVNTANDLRANYLNFAEGTWDKLTNAQRWAVNRQFLDDAIARGDTFKLASLLKEAEPGTYFRRELDYLFSLGYQLVGDVLVKTK
ncbi:MAG: hypothetical protein KDH86_09575, partial [Anaerolineae bacterium]|nr:hypothetical protein [Anaerolineae bacterium]